MRATIAAGCVTLLLLTAGSAAGACPEGVREKVQHDGPASRALEALVACLDDQSPALRDDFAYRTLAQWVDTNAIEPEVRRSLRNQLYETLARPGANGYGASFAALVLSHIARQEQANRWMAAGELDEMVHRATMYVEAVRDYRGFDNHSGWNHGIAHGADWLAVLATDPTLERAHLDAILQAVAVQAVPAAGHAYIYGEPQRLAKVVVLIAGRDLHDKVEWSVWLKSLAARMSKAAFAYEDDAWVEKLARHHDHTAFLHALYVEASLREGSEMPWRSAIDEHMRISR